MTAAETRGPPGGSAFDPTRVYLSVEQDGTLKPLPVDEAFWREIGSRVTGDRMVSVIRQERAWAVWERHPAGDELLVQLSGSLRLTLEESGSVRSVELPAGQAMVVPAGAWHTGDVVRPGDTLFVTAGAGTEGRPRHDPAGPAKP